MIIRFFDADTGEPPPWRTDPKPAPWFVMHTIAVLTRDETMLMRRRFANSDDGFVEMLEAVAGYRDRVWAVEGANGMGPLDRAACRRVRRDRRGRPRQARNESARVLDWAWNQDRRR